MTLRRNVGATMLAAAAVAVLATGCAEVEEAVNKGGDTPCTEYIEQDADKKRITVTKYLDEERGNGGEAPDRTTVDLAIAAIDLMCGAQADPETPIREADLSGILSPR
ncbi:hypothetical protein BOX37_15635 [Nocardia mangyaensis]|uniref:Acid stress chaperone HdeA n=1 Tax=Nocardia mangyaensis TaxID=2213200 RepID=A0A1J0VSY0_9NOCA|nr:hypothetical protein [Nocardia mangyaensis]APE35142.1 hypothetical protein BOX37_15635 [Nocardia mangyaensis]